MGLKKIVLALPELFIIFHFDFPSYPQNVIPPLGNRNDIFEFENRKQKITNKFLDKLEIENRNIFQRRRTSRFLLPEGKFIQNNAKNEKISKLQFYRISFGLFFHVKISINTNPRPNHFKKCDFSKRFLYKNRTL